MLRDAAVHEARRAAATVRAHGDEVGGDLVDRGQDLGPRIAHAHERRDARAEPRELLAHEVEVLAHLVHVHGGLADIFTTIRALAARTGDADQAARAVSRIEDTLADIRKRVAGQPRPRTMIVFGREPGSLRNVYASGGYGFLHDILEIAGAEDVFSDIKRESVQASST